MDRRKKRDWKSYEEKLVKRGEMLIPIGMAGEWRRELEGMNAGKEGAPYDYPDQLIECLSLWKCLCTMPYRSVEGLGRRILLAVGIESKPDHTTLCRRFTKLGKKFYNEKRKVKYEEPIYAVFDGSGLKVCDRGEWMHYKHKGNARGL